MKKVHPDTMSCLDQVALKESEIDVKIQQRAE
jgi:hypothetical protein